MENISSYITEKFAIANNGDEFYTQERDIAKEMPNYKFANKVVYCNCDDPKFSNFYKYFKDNFGKLKLKRLYATYYDKNPKCYEYDGNNEVTSDIKSGDFRDNEEILKRADIIVTNPPFSGNGPEDLLKMCISNGKDFIFLGPNHFATKKYTLDQQKAKKCYIGYNKVYTFGRPDGEKKNQTCFWYTSFKTEKPKLDMTKKYSPEEYPKYDNYDAIHCKEYKNIPKDYDGVIGTSIDFPMRMNTSQFEIVGAGSPKLDGKTVMKKCFVRLKK